MQCIIEFVFIIITRYKTNTPSLIHLNLSEFSKKTLSTRSIFFSFCSITDEKNVTHFLKSVVVLGVIDKHYKITIPPVTVGLQQSNTYKKQL
jgi:hypothetical protein